jgi:hypothetical protein
LLIAFSRLPDGDTFLALEDNGGWNIRRYAAGLQRYSFAQPPHEPIPVAMECWGWAGQELTDLGSFTASHPREEWDGRDLTGVGSAFTAVYRIQPFLNYVIVADHVVIVDPDLPAPTNVRWAGSSANCYYHSNKPDGNELWPGEGGWMAAFCPAVWEDTIVWDWEGNDEFTRANIDGFRLYINEDIEGHPDDYRISPATMRPARRNGGRPAPPICTTLCRARRPRWMWWSSASTPSR